MRKKTHVHRTKAVQEWLVATDEGTQTAAKADAAVLGVLLLQYPRDRGVSVALWRGLENATKGTI